MYTLYIHILDIYIFIIYIYIYIPALGLPNRLLAYFLVNQIHNPLFFRVASSEHSMAQDR